MLCLWKTMINQIDGNSLLYWILNAAMCNISTSSWLSWPHTVAQPVRVDGIWKSLPEFGKFRAY